MSRRVLVTGAAGFLGHHVVEHLLEQTDWTVVGTASFRHRGCPARLEHLHDHPRFELVRTVLDAPLTPRVRAQIGRVDAILNLAAESHVDRSIADPVPFIVNNVQVACTVMELARQVEPEHVIQFSTDEVYGPAPLGYAHREWDAIRPSNPYSASKAAQESIALAYRRTYGVPVTIVNAMNLIGERQEPEKLIPVVIRGVMDGTEVPIYGASEAEVGSRIYLHARSAADALLWLLSSQSSPHTGDPPRWNIVGEQEVNNLDMARRIASLVGGPLRLRLVDFHASRPGHDRRYALDGSALAATGWRAPIDFDEALRRTVRWTCAHPEWLRP